MHVPSYLTLVLSLKAEVLFLSMVIELQGIGTNQWAKAKHYYSEASIRRIGPGANARGIWSEIGQLHSVFQ